MINPRTPLQARNIAIKTIPIRFISAFLHPWQMGHLEVAVAFHLPASGSPDNRPSPIQARSGCDPRFFAEGDTSLVWSMILPAALKRSARCGRAFLWCCEKVNLPLAIDSNMESHFYWYFWCQQLIRPGQLLHSLVPKR